MSQHKTPRPYGVPCQQPYFAYSTADKRWRSVMPPSTPPLNSSQPQAQPSSTPLCDFTIYSWNIDFMIPLGNERLTAALNHLHSLITQSSSSEQSASTSLNNPSIILLQEMTQSDLKIIQAQPWIQAGYYVTDTTTEFWESSLYGTCTLILRAMRVRDVFRVYYSETVMERDALFVDIDVGNVNESVRGGDERGRNDLLRVCNTHLESLALNPPRRPAQMKCAARFMNGEEGGSVLASVLGGDLNAIQPFDVTLPAENGLQDAYLVAGGKEGREEGCTWGQMAKTKERERFGLSRMDKLLFHGSVELKRFETFGYGVEIEGEAQREVLIQQGLEKPWVTDHLGVKGIFHLRKKAVTESRI